ncbi:LysM peptidoglycan-binding domain-containing protein [Enterococcus faecalis]|uniref:LysM peptidoglycan-binding domain-containing protein n=1 Tax=Enterococcus faecalis TaxID=1351 RepID=UPI0021C8AC3E|nr:LysM domain-containing protein [Enterococcus faecalis]MCU2207830.1 LysM peptidoglycan-binding domain-containing protein [Enterococcus faecalis]
MAREKKASIKEETKKELPKTSHKTTHTVSEGETASGIATQYHMSLRKLLALNELESANEVTEGVRLLVE